MAPGKLENGAQQAIKWRPIILKIVPDVVLTSLIAGYLYLSSLRLHFTSILVSFTLSHFKKSNPTLVQVLQPLS